MDDKICFITGANSGIGKAAAIQLAQLGFYVLIGSRNKERGLFAVTEIKNKSKSDLVELIEIDMSLKASILDASKNIKNKFKKLDVLIHNAADFDISRKIPILTEEGVETIWATNHIGPVFLTNHLLQLIKQSEQGRIITVASQGLMLHPKLEIDFKDPEYKTRNFSVSKAYYQSKLAQVMYTYWLAKKFADTSITVNCVRVTNVIIDLKRYSNLSGLMKFMYSIKSKFSISPDEMAKTYTYLATSTDLRLTTGKYFNEKKMTVDSSPYSKNFKNIEELMVSTTEYIE
ncbi:MAG: SDR family NAD(P)-dependent oxidoreductase [Candidatus Delongbacteria bacterium]|nr:SDR family NAD(P)-dependent oxidoreductase [Candidatus Delongbacteria bacterium]MBN2836174.1 SDR family NAD(P)-dependent oxidoreductase [Candidatus Delongbacteria bacterium]